MRPVWSRLFPVVLLLAAGAALAADAPRFPHRAKFKSVRIMEPEQLNQQLDKVILVDVRSRYEYDTLHIKGAVHIPLHKDKLPLAVKELRQRDNRPIVFYCNGIKCKKSYEATEIAMNNGIANVYAYDSGLDVWTKHYPEHSVLLGQSPMKSSDLIDGASFKRHIISAAQFETHVDKGSIVLDIRDLRQRDVALFPFKEHRATLDDKQKIAEVVAEAKRTNKPLVIYDKVGRQTRWFQYYLENQGLKNYYFLDGGAEGYHESKFGKLGFQVPDQS